MIVLSVSLATSSTPLLQSACLPVPLVTMSSPYRGLVLNAIQLV